MKIIITKIYEHEYEYHYENTHSNIESVSINRTIKRCDCRP